MANERLGEITGLVGLGHHRLANLMSIKSNYFCQEISKNDTM